VTQVREWSASCHASSPYVLRPPSKSQIDEQRPSFGSVVIRTRLISGDEVRQ
jgi:hypothetical protein